ncbi:DUF4397 domain-containing protein [Simiduia curdlanivorans]|uniref:DUF4397 domain-containing protein n=1 Tax=Simiduia curdlanivorans TaxID=1492769 RepID=A0ABV8V672_9GAMM|nr:DUF4397 domain-containing protein [Simiduia curdlanivorans]MDN3640265.1 DUF4397 domain-containing protein [Simiduia curdlanivorans]
MNIRTLAAVGLLPLVLAGCPFDDDDDDPIVEPEVLSTSVRVFHASPDAPAVNLLVNGGEAAAGLDYAQSTGVLTLDEGTYTVAVEGIVPAGNVTVIGPVDLDLVGDTHYDVIAANAVADIEPIVISDSGSLSDASLVRVRVAHLTATAPAVNVFVTAPTDDITGLDPLGTFSFGEVLGPVEVAAGDYRIRVTLADDTLVYDSGTVNLSAGKDLLVGAIPTFRTDDAPIKLAVLDGDAVAILHDQNDGANLRVVHDSADAPAVDVYLNDAAMPAIEDLEFPNAVGYVNLAAGDYDIEVTAANTTSAVINADGVALANGASYTVIALNQLANIEPLVLTDNERSVATEARVRLIHGSSLAGNVDIYVVEQLADISMASPAFSDIPFKADTGYVSLAAGDYDVVITPTGTTTEAIRVSVSLENGGIYTAIARDGVGLTTPLGVIGLDGLAPI